MEITISATMVAWYGAIVATLSLVVSGYVAIRDRVRVRVEARPNFRVMGAQSEYDPEKNYICVTVANIGRRPVTIGSVALIRKGETGRYLLLSDSVREGARELSEGESTTYIAEQDELDHRNVSGVVAYDQSGRQWKGKLKWADD